MVTDDVFWTIRRRFSEAPQKLNDLLADVGSGGKLLSSTFRQTLDFNSPNKLIKRHNVYK
ncbi:hypothetical protein Smp_144100 [Schistosoma mansoni]|uniref:Uncharacterized protein n=1 Tax=Schistosoma mansoni TaxID=6183 RepID=G4VB37_SCHMA|nr:hypothetical protein Smp_144100 [Schistosoma mansoni]|eukprot:XP_018649420.1 hypothetical protein Smp_144100 [Schistosoma mansoni]